jgi:energy-coupling factor transport system permease protein
LEAVIYGLCTAFMYGGVVLLFTCYNAVMTSDKFIWLFGRILPARSLVIAMALRFIPRYTAQAKKIAAARRGLGFDVASGKLPARIRNGGEILSVMVTWALENGVETGDSMLSRGYGLKGRTAYSIYRFDSRDKAVLLTLSAFMLASLACCFAGAVSIEFYPRFIMAALSPVSVLAYLCHGAACLTPFILEIREDAQWRYLKSKI